MIMDLSDLISYFKEVETAENIIPLTDNEELRNGLVAWKSVIIDYRESSECIETSESRKWEWVWTQVEFDIKEFAVVAGCNPQNAYSIFARLKGLRLIYPDGTIHGLASKYLQAIIMSKLPKPKK
jgi:hypothetical protein